ncbi:MULTISPECIES: hybrid sensor histidine kinase/response regulator [Pseudanabaena]|uniref:histidine kinase n=2 Tax=Pseudanabaena TaxID=1152 RepID=L8MSQ8_9CYAN|nr:MULTISPECIES: hybrid sensor histidine kinase/response regulator [Pseudanabaena]ELS30496.1 response regulator receiver sensor signal transduction histidine kinase [Pseudanabaena biceps PCC 7429]MDG3497233.1 hybrid sensor histidine kinase/response regulator [Pseudanabaena catenata USMAC16]
MTCILVIEDEDLIRDSLEDLLSVEGFDVITAENGAEGLTFAKQRPPDLILCDVMMPILNGYEVLQQLRQDKTLSTVPFLFLTSMMDRRSNRKGMMLGADDYLEKPCTKDELLEAISVRLNKQKAIDRHIEEKLEALRTSITLSLPHELQTPLSGIMGLSELMMLQSEELLPAEVYEYSEGIHHSAERLYRLIQNYLLYSRLIVMRSQGQSKFTSIYSCSSHITIAVVGDRKAKMYGRSSDLEMDLAETELAISSDDLAKIAGELIDNAFKYSPKGRKVYISSKVSEKAWILKIQDFGRGMSTVQIANVGAFIQFNRQFYEQQGLGLGLCLAKTLVEFYGGSINIQSQENEGTNLCISIPL